MKAERGYYDAYESQEPLMGKRPVRWNVWVCLIVVFLSNIGFSIVVPSIWPFFQSLGGKIQYLGFAIGCFNLGQTVGGPVLGYVYNNTSAKTVLIISLLFTITGDFLYALSPNEWVMLGSRLITGFGAGNQAVAQAYMASITTPSERSKKLAYITGVATVAFIVGPSIAVALDFAHYQPNNIVKFTGYTLPGYISGLIGIVNLLVVVLLLKSNDDSYLPLEDTYAINSESPIPSSLPEPFGTPSSPTLNDSHHTTNVKDGGMLVVCFLNLIFFFIFSGASTFEAVLVPFTMDTYGWGLKHNSTLWAACNAVSAIAYMLLPFLTKVVGDPGILTIAMAVLASGFGLLFDWTDAPLFVNSADLPLWRFFLGCGMVSLGFPLAMSGLLATYAKALTNHQQSFVYGLLTLSGAVSRIVGPLWSTALYQIEDPYMAFFIVALCDICAFILMVAMIFKLNQIIKSLQHNNAWGVSYEDDQGHP